MKIQNLINLLILIKLLKILIIPVKEGENIERALKKFKKKFDKTKAMKELRRRKEFTKPSVVKRQDNIRAVYREKIMSVGQ